MTVLTIQDADLKCEYWNQKHVMWGKFSRYAEHPCQQNLQTIKDVEYSSESDSESDNNDWIFTKYAFFFAVINNC